MFIFSDKAVMYEFLNSICKSVFARGARIFLQFFVEVSIA